jgi:hypothetical protein
VNVTTWPDIVIMLISAATGGGLLKIVDTWLNRAKMKSDSAKQLRDEAREEASALKTEVNYFRDRMREKEKEIDDWRTKYWDVFMQYKTFQLKVGQILIDNGISPNALLKEDDDA